MKDSYIKQAQRLMENILGRMQGGSKEEQLFTEQFFAKLPLAELSRYADNQAAEIARSALRFMQERDKNSAKIRIFVPNKKEHGYDSSRPVIELINDDKPFLLDSLISELSHAGISVLETIHPIFFVNRDEKGRLKNIKKSADETTIKESFIHFEIYEIPESIGENGLIKLLENTLQFVSAAVADWQIIVKKVESCELTLEKAKNFSVEEIEEARDFLKWLANKNFVFLGYLYVDFEDGEVNNAKIDAGSLLGISKLDDIPKKVHASSALIDIRKASRKSPVHRPVLMDVVTIKKLDAAGKIIGEHRIYGLFTSVVYYQSTDLIPFVRQKVRHVQEQAGFDTASHDGKALKAILEFLPRDELLQINEDDLFALSLGILAMEFRPSVKIFVRKDIPGRYLSCLVFVPKEYFSTEVRRYIQAALEKEFSATHESFSTHVGESSLARLYIILRASKETPEIFDTAKIESEISSAIAPWGDKLKEKISNVISIDKSGSVIKSYINAFSPAYTNRYSIEEAIKDIEIIETAIANKSICVDLRRESERYSLKIFNPNKAKTLSDLLPTLENMGLVTFEEHPFLISPQGFETVRMRDILVMPLSGEISDFVATKTIFEEALLKVWNGEVADDELNALLIKSQLDFRQIQLLRAITCYMKQIGFAATSQTITQTLISNAKIARLLAQLFEARFDPKEKNSSAKTEEISQQIEHLLKDVKSLSEDNIIRNFQQLIFAILRTNYYVENAKALSFKFDCAKVPNLPLPKPFAEIFVYSVRVEGIHLRGGKVARGGLRWSDRHDDFRTEVLGLMKAQMVKNAVIVPVGSKGGFVVKKESPNNREAFAKEGIECYKIYLSAMLDITDNIVNGKIVSPKNLVKYDMDDPYLVVAADKGTASFSDTANSVSRAYNFWLDDAFASGGSDGYDHKKMAITARGGFVSVRRHFKEMGVDIDKQSFTCVGIGDMAGDVFGNGALLAPKMRLLAAFNHMHIFIDPNPNEKESYTERKRLFDTPRSSWADYKEFSAGGGVYERTAKLISISEQAQQALSLERKDYTPDDLIKAILCANVDLLWNGGIGTYVKAEEESHDNVGDRANNNVRVNGRDLQAKIVGEGGNLGFTQLGRIEYAKRGGRINTDAIDNSGGVDCSDHEVNIKIALSKAVNNGKISIEARNSLLRDMTDEVAKLVLKDNALQTKAISFEEALGTTMLSSHARLIRTLESRGLLNRSIEYLPDETKIINIIRSGKGFTRPELAVLLAYSKIALYRDIIDSTLPDDSYFAADLVRYFPEAMKKEYADEIAAHPLKREIIATVATNSMVNRAGISFYFEIAEDTGLGAKEIVGAYTLVRDAFSLRDIWDKMEKSSDLSHEHDVFMHKEVVQLLDYTTRRVLKLIPEISDIKAEVSRFKKVVEILDLENKGTLEGKIINLATLKYAIDITIISETSSSTIEAAANIFNKTMQLLKISALLEKTSTVTNKNQHDNIAIKVISQNIIDTIIKISKNIISDFSSDFDKWQSKISAQLENYLKIAKHLANAENIEISDLIIALERLKKMA